MKILDPQSALLPTLELQTFLSSRPKPTHHPKIGGYPTPQLRGYRTITKEFNAYLNNLSSHILDLPSLKTDRWMERVVGVLSRPRRSTAAGGKSKDDGEEDGGDEEEGQEEGEYGYGLTKGEVFMILELGLGMRRTGEEEGTTEEDYEASDTQVLHAVVEELGERFSDEEVSKMLRDVRGIVDGARVKEEGGEES